MIAIERDGGDFPKMVGGPTKFKTKSVLYRSAKKTGLACGPPVEPAWTGRDAGGIGVGLEARMRA